MFSERNGYRVLCGLLIILALWILSAVINDNAKKETQLNETEATDNSSQIEFNHRMNRPICSECGKQYDEEDAQDIQTNDGRTITICGKDACVLNLMARGVRENGGY